MRGQRWWGGPAGLVVVLVAACAPADAAQPDPTSGTAPPASSAPAAPTTTAGHPTAVARHPTTAVTRGRAGAADAAPGCGERAVAAGRFDPSCAEYQGYLDPGTRAGRGPTSGDVQLQNLCRTGQAPASDCAGVTASRAPGPGG
ncbi:hypothetical protein [Pseudonocardia sp. D17]|uniref:hypothetical protein n=1 Tax=Pseudonocardia sp. D17 TaxID=882661 RepID=UPI0030CAD4E0